MASCAKDGTAPSGPGSLEVTVSTTGEDPDPDGYSVSVDGQAYAVGDNDTVSITDLSGGTHQVAIADVAANCSVEDGEASRNVEVTPGATTPVTLSVACARVTADWLLAAPIGVTLNPSGRVPLAAELTVKAIMPVRVGVTVPGAEPLSYDLTEVGATQSVPVVGLYPGTTNRVELRLTPEDSSFVLKTTVEIATDSLPDLLPDVQITTADTARMEPGWNLASFSAGLGSTFGSWPFMFDDSGAIRWYLDLSTYPDIVYLLEPLANGDLIYGQGSALFEIDVLGREVHRWLFPGYAFHHFVYEKPNGNFLVGVDVEGRPTVEDEVIEIDRSSGAILRTWDMRQVLDVDRAGVPGAPNDWFHNNAAWYSPDDDDVIISGRNQGVVKVTGDNHLVWILAPHKGWEKAGPDGNGEETAPYLLTAVDADGNPYPDSVQQGYQDAPDFRWSWGQHAVMLLPNGDIFLFDNGANRNWGSAGPSSRGVEYHIDETNRTIRQVWEYGFERGPDYASGVISDVDYLPLTGNRLIMPGIVVTPTPRAFVTEVTYPDKDVAFEGVMVFKDLHNPGTGGWGGVDIVYRSECLRPTTGLPVR